MAQGESVKKQVASEDSWCPSTWQGWVFSIAIALILSFGVMPWVSHTLNGCHEGDAYFHGKIDGRNEAPFNLKEVIAYSSDYSRTKAFCVSKGFSGGTQSANFQVYCGSDGRYAYYDFQEFWDYGHVH